MKEVPALSFTVVDMTIDKLTEYAIHEEDRFGQRVPGWKRGSPENVHCANADNAEWVGTAIPGGGRSPKYDYRFELAVNSTVALVELWQFPSGKNDSQGKCIGFAKLFTPSSLYTKALQLHEIAQAQRKDEMKKVVTPELREAYFRLRQY